MNSAPAQTLDAPPGYWRALALAVIYRAVLDARRGDPAAVEWLTGEAGRAWAEPLDLPCWPPPGLGIDRTKSGESVVI